MEYSDSDQRRVYLACRPIFTGPHALLRRSKKVRELVSTHQKSLRPLIQEFTTEKVVNIIKHLLEKEIFQSDVKAKVEFPELFHSSPTRDAQRAASENDAARSAAEALEEVASRENINESDDEKPNDLVDLIQDTAKSSAAAEQSSQALSLYPMYFPYHTQHVILSKVQSVLEECCFYFVQKWKPSILSDRGWNCAAAVELTGWTKLLVKISGQLPKHAFNLDNQSLDDVLFATHKLRHTAVHRLPTTCRGVETLVKSAIRLAEAVQDQLRAAQLENLRLEIDSQIMTIELSKNSLEDAFCQELKKIKRQREELDLQEQELAAKMISEDRNNNCLVGNLLQDSLAKLFDVKSSGVNTNDVDQLSNTKEKHPKDDSAIDNHAADNPSSTTKVPFITGSSDFHSFNPFEPYTIKQSVLDFSILELSEPMRSLERERRRGLVAASITGYPNRFHGFNPFEPFPIKHSMSDFRFGA